MFVEFSPSGWILAAYVEQQYPNQKWVPPSNEALQYFLSATPRLGKDAKGRTCPGSQQCSQGRASGRGSAKPGQTQSKPVRQRPTRQ